MLGKVMYTLRNIRNGYVREGICTSSKVRMYTSSKVMFTSCEVKEGMHMSSKVRMFVSGKVMFTSCEVK